MNHLGALIGGLLIAVQGLGTGTGTAPIKDDLITQKTLKAVVKITIDDESKICAGFRVSPTIILTARHCVQSSEGDENNSIDVRADGKPVTIIASSEKLALVKEVSQAGQPAGLKPGETAKLTVGEGFPADLEAVSTLSVRGTGVPLSTQVRSFGFAFGSMTILARSVARLEFPDLILDGPLIPGMSGGPVIDSEGMVVGINQASNSLLSVICGAEEITHFLEKFK